MDLSTTAKAMSLPTELLFMIFGRLHKSEMKNVRLVCQEWCSLATPSLFDRLHFSPFPKDFEVFSQWTRTPRCATAVKELVYDASSMNLTIKEHEYITRLGEYLRDMKQSRIQAFGIADEEYLELIHADPTSMRKLSKKEIVNQGLKSYVEQARQHLALRLSGEILYHLTRGMQHLTNLESVRLIDDEDDLQGREDHRTFFYRHWPGGADDDDFQPKFPGPMRQSGSPFARSWHPFYLPPSPCSSDEEGEYYIHESQHPFRLLVTSLSLGQRNIKSFRAHSGIDHKVPLSVFNVTGEPSSLLIGRHLSYVLSTIESLHLEFDCEASGDTDECLEGLQSYLLTLSRLRDLHINVNEFRRGVCSFRKIFGAPRRIWPRLTEFTLGGVHATQHDLVGFLAEHSMRRLELTRVHLTMGSWVTTVDALQELNPTIERAYLHDITGPSGCHFRSRRTRELMQAAAQYITSGGFNPLLGQEIAGTA